MRERIKQLIVTVTLLLFVCASSRGSQRARFDVTGPRSGTKSSRDGALQMRDEDERREAGRPIKGGFIPADALESMEGFDDVGQQIMGADGDLMVSGSSSSPSSSSGDRGGNDDSMSSVRITGNEAEFEVTTINDKNYQMVKSEMELGKDKELFHFTLDFVRIWDVISRKSTWRSIGRKMMKTLARVTGRDDYNVLFKELAVEMLGDIRRQDRGSSLKLFKGTIKQAEAYARGKGTFIIVYIEEAGREQRSAVSEDSAVFRRALSDPELGKLLNDEFVFFAGSTRHNPTFRLARQLGPFKKKDFPLLVALAPSYVDMPSKSAGVPEKLAVFGVPSRDVDAKKIMQFLARVKKLHGPALQAKQKEFLELLEDRERLDGE